MNKKGGKKRGGWGNEMKGYRARGVQGGSAEKGNWRIIRRKCKTVDFNSKTVTV